MHYLYSPSKMSENFKKRKISLETDIIDSLPILYFPDYYVQPSLDELIYREIINSGYCGRVHDFTVGRVGYGCIKFVGETDVRSLDLGRIVKFNRHSVSVYENESEKPFVGHGLNKPAEVTLVVRVKLPSLQGAGFERIIRKLRRCNERQGAYFISFDYMTCEWKFSVQHFSRFGLSGEDEDDDISMEEDDSVQNNEEDDDNDKFHDAMELSHSLPAHLGLDPLKMHEMRMVMFPAEDEDLNEDEDLDAPFPQKRCFGTEYGRESSPSSSAKYLLHRYPLHDPMKKAINKPSPLRKAPQALLEYHTGSSSTISPSQSILMTRQNKGLPPRTTKVEGFKLHKNSSSPFDGHLSNNIVDAALFMGKSFRVGWGPNGVLVHTGSPVSQSGTGLSSIINIERVATDRVVRDEENKIKEEWIDLCFASPLNLHKSLDHKFENIKVGSFNLKLQKVVANRFTLPGICRDYLGIMDNQLSDLSASSCLMKRHQVMIWELIKILFQEREAPEQLRSSVDVVEDGDDMVLDKKVSSLDVDPEAKPYVRRADFSMWLQDNVCHRVQEELSRLNGSDDLEHILLLLTGRQINAAVELAASRGDVRLAILLSQCGGSIMNRRDMAWQLDLWRNNGLDFNFIEKNRLRLYELLAGNIEGALGNSSIDWKRYIGLVLWFQLPPDTSLPFAIQTFNHLLSEGRAPHPVPIYVDESPADELVKWSEGDRYDIAYYLMLLHAHEEKPFDFVQTMFSAFSSTHDPLDYHMIWHYRAVLEAIGTFSSNDLYVLDMSFISQLLCLGKCHWAIYVALHMPFHKDYPHLQAKLIKEILFQYCELWSMEESHFRFIKDLGIPPEWMHEALVRLFNLILDSYLSY